MVRISRKSASSESSTQEGANTRNSRDYDAVCLSGDEYDGASRSHAPRYPHVPVQHTRPARASARSAPGFCSEPKSSYYISEDETGGYSSPSSVSYDSDDSFVDLKARPKTFHTSHRSTGHYAPRPQPAPSRSRDEYLHVGHNGSTYYYPAGTEYHKDSRTRTYSSGVMREGIRRSNTSYEVREHFYNNNRADYDVKEARPRGAGYHEHYEARPVKAFYASSTSYTHAFPIAHDDGTYYVPSGPTFSAAPTYKDDHRSYCHCRGQSRCPEHCRRDPGYGANGPRDNKNDYYSSTDYPRTNCTRPYNSSSSRSSGSSRVHERPKSSTGGSRYYSKTDDGGYSRGTYSRPKYYPHEPTSRDSAGYYRSTTGGKYEHSSPKSSGTPRPKAPPPSAELIDIPDHYATLDVSTTANASEIKRAARQKRIENHPDRLKRPGMSKSELARIDEGAKKVGMAADVLSDEKAKREYDRLRSKIRGQR
ncbi:MAG: hypothetical protein Q9163_002383 [Psora crenata]